MKPRMILLGGFLGAGKSTLAVGAARMLRAKGFRPGIITNDQSTNLIDTAMAKGAEVNVTEVGGGCFCCKFPALLDAAEALKAAGQANVIIAEAVGSCTDLVATVLRPLRMYHPDEYELAPLTIVVDPVRLMAPMAEIVDYLYKQQLLEADVILLNKTDLVSRPELDAVKERLEAAAGGIKVIVASASRGEGLSEWLDYVTTNTCQSSNVLDLDYRKYTEAEAQLGWLNASGTFKGPARISLNQWAKVLLSDVASEMAQVKASIAHVKVLAQSGMSCVKASLTGDGGDISWDLRPTDDGTQVAQFLFNARVCAPPQLLEERARRAINASMEKVGAKVSISEWSCFSPPPPRPTYRLAV